MKGYLLLTYLLCAELPSSAAMQTVANTQRYEVKGTVVDHLNRRPVARALVRLSPVTGQGQLTSLTAVDGRFEFSNIPKGKYRLAAQRPGQTPQQFNETGQYSTAIVVGPGIDSGNIVFALHSQTAISGVVVDQDGDPVPSTRIALFRELVSEGEKRVVELGGSATNSQGQFRIGQLFAGTYYVAAQGTAWFASGVTVSEGARPETDVVYPLTYYGDTTDAAAAAPVALTEGVTAQLQITLHPVPNIHVPIPVERSNEPHGGNMPQLFVRGPGGLQIASGAMYSSSADSSGRQRNELSGIGAGSYLVQLSPNGRPGRTGSEEVEVADGVPLTVPGRARNIALSGQVTFEGGQRSGNALQLMFIDDDERNRFVIPVGADGAFTLSNESASPGSYLIQAFGADFYVKSIAAKGVRVVKERVELLPGSSAQLSLVATPIESLSKLDGFVTREGKPAAGSMVLLVPSDIARTRLFRRDQSDSDGSFTMPAILPGRYTLLAIDDQGRGLVYKDPAVIKPYLAAGQTLNFPLHGTEPVKVQVQPRIQ